MATEHSTTCTDEQVRGHWGTVARCICGWKDAWAIQGGNAEASAAEHMYRNDAEYRAAADERARIWEGGRPAREAEAVARRDRIVDSYLALTPLGPAPRPADPCHECVCHLNPPCGWCENCKHLGGEITDCENDCQDCEIDHEY